MFNPRRATLIAMILFAAIIRLLPHPWNFTPVNAMALFAGAQFADRRLALAVPFGAIVLSDLFLGFYPGWWSVYMAYAAIVLIGFQLRGHQSPVAVTGAAVSGSIFFFLISNIGYWLTAPQIPKTIGGLMQSYVQAIPFFRGTLMSDLVYAGVLFGGLHLMERRFPALQESFQPAR